ncbi:MAG TPA: hypothetical protein VEA39_04185 [Methylophilaceae bacterium]|nr:hypothetical protein [Methylophilaceae bacterium]
MAQQNPSPLDTSRNGVVSQAQVQKELASAHTEEAAPEELRGVDVKKARGLEPAACGHNEAGTDQKVEDSKRLNHGKEKC